MTPKLIITCVVLALELQTRLFQVSNWHLHRHININLTHCQDRVLDTGLSTITTTHPAPILITCITSCTLTKPIVSWLFPFHSLFIFNLWATSATIYKYIPKWPRHCCHLYCHSSLGNRCYISNSSPQWCFLLPLFPGSNLFISHRVTIYIYIYIHCPVSH